MKKVLLFLVVIGFAGQAMALTVTKDGVLTEWVGNEINNLGTVSAPDGGSYTLLATWDGTELHLGMDRDSSNRYLGDNTGSNDSFFIAIDLDGIPGSGMTFDRWNRVSFAGPMLPDALYCFEGGPNWYQWYIWNGVDWGTESWTDFNQYYGQSELDPDDELTPPLQTDLTIPQFALISGDSELLAWAWMNREINALGGYVEASWPDGLTGIDPNMGAPFKIRTAAALLSLPHDPSPISGATDVPIAGLALSWSVAQSIGGVVDPLLASHKLYMSDGTTPSLALVGSVAGWDAGTLIASHTPSPELNKNSLYYWRVDQVMTDTSEITGDVWSFQTEATIPIITDITPSQIIDAGVTAIFTTTVDSVSTPTYQWYLFVDGISDVALSDGGDISGATTASLSIANTALADEGNYYCVVNNDAGIPVTSIQVPLGIKRILAHWDFESANANSVVVGSPVSFLFGDPNFVTPGIQGDAMSFANTPGAEEILYTDPAETSYFDICNYSMTVSCWIKSASAATWGPLIARNGEENGWQLRHNGNTLDRISFTTRDTGDNDDGTPSTRTVYDDLWHYAVGTFDGVTKKVYIDGVLSRTYSSDDGSVAQEFDVVSGAVSPSTSPVALAGRVRGDLTSGLIFEGFSVTPGILDEVKIYNYAQDAAVIAQTYADMTGTAVCPDSTLLSADFNDDCSVDMIEVAILASEWMVDSNVQPTP